MKYLFFMLMLIGCSKDLSITQNQLAGQFYFTPVTEVHLTDITSVHFTSEFHTGAIIVYGDGYVLRQGYYDIINDNVYIGTERLFTINKLTDNHLYITRKGIHLKLINH